MTTVLESSSLALLVFCMFAEVVREVCFKAGASHAGVSGRSYAVGVLCAPLIWAGAVAWAVEAVAWILVLERVPLGTAFPIMTLTYAAVPIAGIVWLRRRLSASQLVGAALVVFGVVWVGVAGR